MFTRHAAAGIQRAIPRTYRGSTNQRHAAALAGAAAVTGGLAVSRSCGDVQAQEAPLYKPPPRYASSFSSLRRAAPKDEPGQLAWAVKNLELDKAREMLSRWPDGARLVDEDGNTLFHLAASQSGRYSAQPQAAAELVQLLLQTGWDVVDAKNAHGERADVVAKKQLPDGVPRQLLVARSHDWHEKMRMEDPIPLVGEISPHPERWQYLVQDEQRRSWLGVFKGAISEEKCKKWFKAHVEKGAWHQPKDIPRKTAWYVSEDCLDCPYRYGGLEYKAHKFPPFMEEIRAEVCKACGIPPEQYPNCCNVNIYADQSHEVGWHSDDEVLFQGLAGDARIISFSLGVERDFCWRLQGTADTLGCAPLGNGDIATMEGLFQKHYKHSVPPTTSTCGPRINMTFRWIVAKADAHDAHVKTKV
mmetsp:Transcript_65974/g.157758  ORF Transcript_65974/g.157758 Transcript_65974/m.157758 type:complete len:416 (-) Transcript_65974:89-1336(-)